MKYWISVLFLGHIVKGLDVEVLNTTCDKSLPVTADFHLRCSQGSKCTFGQNSTVYGTGTFLCHVNVVASRFAK